MMRELTPSSARDGLLTRSGALTLKRHADHGLVTATSLGAVETEKSYSAFGELASFSASIADQTIYDAHYIRDRLGRITEKTEIIGGQPTVFTYTYDTSGRLASVGVNGSVTEVFGYDPNGNRTHVNGVQIATYDEQDRLLTHGPLNKRPIPSQRIAYVVDGRNRRIGKLRDGELVQGLVYRDQLNPIAELDGAGNIVAVFAYGEKSNVPAYLIRNNPETGEQTTYRILSDHLGSPRIVINVETGEVAQRIDYDVWGRVTLDTNPGFQPFGFAGGIYDPETGLLRFGARDYDPFIGRWTAKDPIGFNGDGWNFYSYALNDTVNSSDPSGLESRSQARRAWNRRHGPRVPNNDASRFGVFGCLLGCLSYTAGDREPQASISTTIGGGIMLCSPPKRQVPPCSLGKRGMYDPIGDDAVVANPGMTIQNATGRVGLGIGASASPDGAYCVQLGLFAGPAPFSIHLGSISE